MDVIVSIPDAFIPPADADEKISRELLEAYAIENYRQERMSLGRIAELLSFSIDETHAFLKAHKIPLNYDLEDMARDRRTVEMFLKK